MASKATIFFAGVGTTFLILGTGFGSGLFMANSALKQPNASISARGEMPNPIRVVLPSSAEAAEPKALVAQPESPVPAPQVQPSFNDAQTAADKAEKSDSKKADADRRRKRMAERKARQLAERRNRRGQEAPVMAFGGDEARPANGSFNLFNN
jgi:hypothetical protein